MKRYTFRLTIGSMAIFWGASLVACANLQRTPDSVKNAKPKVASIDSSAVTPPADQVPISGHVVNCRNGNDVRVLHAEPRGSGCQMVYTKAGKKSVVANATTGLDHCENVVDKIRTKLESVGYTCQ